MIKTLTLAILMIASALTGIDPVKNSTKETGIPKIVYTLGTNPVKFGSISLIGLEDQTFTETELFEGIKATGYVPNVTSHKAKSNLGTCPGCNSTVVLVAGTTESISITTDPGQGYDYGPYSEGNYDFSFTIDSFSHGECIVTSSNNHCVPNGSCQLGWTLWLSNWTYNGVVEYDYYHNGQFMEHVVNQYPVDVYMEGNSTVSCGGIKVHRWVTNDQVTIEIIIVCAACMSIH